MPMLSDMVPSSALLERSRVLASDTLHHKRSQSKRIAPTHVSAVSPSKCGVSPLRLLAGKSSSLQTDPSRISLQVRLSHCGQCTYCKPAGQVKFCGRPPVRLFRPRSKALCTSVVKTNDAMPAVFKVHKVLNSTVL